MSTAAAPSQICDELPAVILPSGNEGRAQRGQRLGRRVPSRRLVHPDERADVRIGHLDRNDLVREAALVDRGDRPPVRLERERVELLSRESPLLGDHLRRDPLRHDLPALEQRIGEVAAVRPHRDTRHHLDAGRDDDVELARLDRRRSVEVALHRRAALAVDGRAADRVGPAGDERSHPADVPALLADLRHAAQLNVLDLPRIEVVPRDERVQDLPRELVAAQLRKRAVPPADRRADCVDDQRVGHPTTE